MDLDNPEDSISQAASGISSQADSDTNNQEVLDINNQAGSVTNPQDSVDSPLEVLVTTLQPVDMVDYLTVDSKAAVLLRQSTMLQHQASPLRPSLWEHTNHNHLELESEESLLESERVF